MANDRTDILFPVARIVAGNLYKASDKDAQGNPKTVKTGPNAGQLRSDFYFAIAIPKNANGQHWAYEPWGAPIWAAGHKQLANAGQMPAFAWKVTDGDSQVPNREGNKPCDREGWPGHWVVHLTSSFAPRILRLEADGRVVDFQGENAVMPGDYVEVSGNTSPNGSQQTPGVYINHNMVCFRGYHPEGRISIGQDPNAIGFGKAAAAGAVQTMPGGAAALPNSPPPAPGAAAPAAPAPVGNAPPNPPVTAAPPASVGTAAPAPNIPVTPAPAMLGTAPPPAAAPAPAAPPAGPQMTAKATTSYDEYKKAGWNDEQLRQHGLMV